MLKPFSLTPKQGDLRDLAASEAMHILAYGGSRSGKTFGFTYCVTVRALVAPEGRHLISRLHNIDVRQSVMMDTFPKVMSLAFKGVDYEINKSDQFATFENGAEIWFGGLDDKDRVDKILGKEFATIYCNEASQLSYQTVLTLRTRLAQSVARVPDVNGVVRPLSLKAYYDLNPTGKGHWTYREFVEGVRPDNGTPLPAGRRAYIVLNPTDNPFLPQAYIDELAEMPQRQRERFLEGKYQTEVAGALWPSERVERLRRADRPEITRVVIGLDPSGSDGTGGDLQGIVVVGLGVDGHGYVLADRSCRLSPEGWARRAVEAYEEFEADVIVAEQNFGGAMVTSTIRTADANVPVKLVTASRGKHIRAEPIAALYEQEKVHHVGTFTELEEQMGMMTTQGYQGGGSPDRLDSLVWALTELMVGQQVRGWEMMELARRAMADRSMVPETNGEEVIYAIGSVEWQKQQDRA